MKDVYLLGSLHDGPYTDLEADMTVGFAPTYRVSWRSTGGKIGLDDLELGPVIEDNDSPWSGGHPSLAKEDVRGVFLSSVPLKLPASGVDVLHIGPTALSLLGVKVPAEMDLEPLQH